VNVAAFAEWSHIGRFRVDGVLGRGGAGTVVRAHDPQLQRPVAIKVLHAGAACDVPPGTTIDLRAEAGATDLLAEARALAQIAHPNVLAIHELGVERGHAFLVMELVEGVHLRAWLAEAARSHAEIVAVFAQAGRGLAAAHRRGIVHRDFKPENVLIDRDGRVRVCDFGIAAFEVGAFALAGRAGTPGYVAPEQWRDGVANAACDVYAFGVALIEAVTGELVASSEAAERALAACDLSPGVRDLVARTTAAEPSRRPSIDQLVAVLEVQPRSARRHYWIVAAGAGLAGGAIAVVAFAGRGADAAPTCDDTERLLAARWTEAHRAGIRSGLVATGAPDAREVGDRIVATLDEYAHAWRQLRSEICTSPEQRPARVACLDRRLVELGSIARVLQKPPNRNLALARSQALPDLATCMEAAESTLPAGVGERAAIEDITTQLIELQHAALAPISEGDQAALAELDRRAAELGDIDLVVRIRKIRGQLLNNTGQLDAAAQQYDAAYELAARHHRDAVAGQILVDSARLAYLRGELGAADSKLEIARGLLERAGEVTPRERVHLYRELGKTKTSRGDLEAAGRAFAAAQQLADQIVPRDDLIAAQVKLERAWLMDHQRRYAEGLTLARQAAGELRALGHGVADLGSALQVIASLEAQRGNSEAALATHRERLALLERHMPEQDSGLLAARADVGIALLAIGRYDEAIETFRQTAAIARELPSLAKHRPYFLGQLARAYRLQGRIADARAQARLAVDDARERLGPRAHAVGDAEIRLASLALEAGDLAAAATHVRIAEDVFADVAPGHEGRLELASVQIDLLLARGEAAAAHDRALEVLALLAESKRDDIRDEWFKLAAARARAQLGEHRGALELARQAYDQRVARGAKAYECALAEVEVAKARYQLGEREVVATLRSVERALRDPHTRPEHAALLEWARSRGVRVDR
jgi:eukaryotic-like serine/threonine-protein kinase